MAHTLRCFAVTLALPLVALTAQETPILQSGSRVRVTNYPPNSTHWVRSVGTLESVDSTTIVVQDNDGRSISFPREASTRLDVSAGPGACTGDRRGGCLALGFFGGAGLGFLAGAVAISGSDCGEECGLIYLFTVPLGALVGTVVGATVGGEHWRGADLPAQIRIGPAGAHGLALRLSVPL